MVDVRRTTTRTTFIRSTETDRMTVFHLREFIKALDDSGIPDDVYVTSRRENAHLSTLSVQWNEDLEP